jgi:nucleotide-binding universal stress UspA family protein
MTLVVMGTHGASGWKEFVVGSNTEKIVRSSPVPVIALRKAMTKRSIRHIVLPTTLELDQTAFMNQVKDLQEFFRAKIHVLFLNTPANFVRDADSIASLKDFARYYKLRNFTLNVRSEHQESDGIIHFAKEIKANMIAMGTHGRKGLSHLMTGSIAEDVVNHLQLPIWTSQLRRE